MEDQIKAVFPHRESTGPSFVYLMYCEGYYKVGYSYDPQKRREGIQTGCPFEVNIVSVFETITPLWDESYLHVLLQSYQYRGEWFDIPSGMQKDLSWFAPNPSPKPNPANCNVEERMKILTAYGLSEKEIIYCVLGVKPSFGRPYEIAKQEYDDLWIDVLPQVESSLPLGDSDLTEEQSYSMISALKKSGFTQDQIIEKVFRVKKGSSKKYKSARAIVQETIAKDTVWVRNQVISKRKNGETIEAIIFAIWNVRPGGSPIYLHGRDRVNEILSVHEECDDHEVNLSTDC